MESGSLPFRSKIVLSVAADAKMDCVYLFAIIGSLSAVVVGDISISMNYALYNVMHIRK